MALTDHLAGAKTPQRACDAIELGPLAADAVFDPVYEAPGGRVDYLIAQKKGSYLAADPRRHRHRRHRRPAGPRAAALRPGMERNWVVRPVGQKDLDGLYALAVAMGPGMTTFPADRDVLEAKVARSEASFASKRKQAEAAYLMVLADLDSGEILGTSALYTDIGAEFGFFSYKRIRLVQRSSAIDAASQVELLTLSNDYTGATEIGTLTVRPDLKGSGAGKLLARSRYMLVATRPKWFGPILIAEMRGWQRPEGASPFWDAVGARFFNMDFETADRMSAARGNDFIAELMPRHPLYVDLLPHRARSAIGRPHAASAPAMALLRQEGFRYDGYVDVFDAGPQMHADRDAIATVRDSRRSTVAAGEGGEHGALVSAWGPAGFRVARARVRAFDGEATLDAGTRARLGVGVGEEVRVCRCAS